MNLDSRVGDAWRFYNRNGRISLFPSIWLTSGCESHFILWSNQVFWFPSTTFDSPTVSNYEIERKLIACLRCKKGSASYVELAEKIEEIPWDVLVVAQRLARKGILVEEKANNEGRFKLAEE